MTKTTSLGFRCVQYNSHVIVILSELVYRSGWYRISNRFCLLMYGSWLMSLMRITFLAPDNWAVINMAEWCMRVSFIVRRLIFAPLQKLLTSTKAKVRVLDLALTPQRCASFTLRYQATPTVVVRTTFSSSLNSPTMRVVLPRKNDL